MTSPLQARLMPASRFPPEIPSSDSQKFFVWIERHLIHPLLSLVSASAGTCFCAVRGKPNGAFTLLFSLYSGGFFAVAIIASTLRVGLLLAHIKRGTPKRIPMTVRTVLVAWRGGNRFSRKQSLHLPWGLTTGHILLQNFSTTNLGPSSNSAILMFKYQDVWRVQSP